MNALVEQNNQNLGIAEVESRQLSEIKGKIFIAKQFPRDEERAIQAILRECQSKRLAECAEYVFSRGTSEVRGASIRLAEVVARHWGNFDCGITEIEQRDGESTVKAYAWDLESNYRDEKIFTVSHIRETKKGKYKLEDSRDIYEKVANDGARRKRACILAVIPGYIFDMALEACEKTLNDSIKGEKDISEIREQMFVAFKTIKDDVTKEQLAGKVGKEDFDTIDALDIVKLRNLFNAIKDGFVKPSIAFGEETEELPTTEEDKELKKLNQQIMGAEK